MLTMVFGKRKLIVLRSAEAATLSNIGKPFALLLPTTPGGPTSDEQHIVEQAVSQQCVEICSVGADAERLHDYIDGVLEDRGLFDVVTTWHTDEPIDDTMFYFVHVAGGAPPILVAFIAGESGLLEDLKRTIEESVSREHADGRS